MGTTLLGRALDRGRAGARALRGRLSEPRDAPAPVEERPPEPSAPAPTHGDADTPAPLPERAASPGEIAELRRALTDELDQLAQRQDDAGAPARR